MKLYKRIILKLMSLGFFNWLPDEPYLKWKFRLSLAYNLNLNNPKTFNEKLNWLKLYNKNKKFDIYVDKYAVREYIAKIIGEKYLIPLIGVYNNTNEIPWSELPNRFVLKCNHASGTNIICEDKTKLDIKKSKKLLDKWLKINYFYPCREYPYKNIKPCIICEEFISDSKHIPDDYKFMCFNGIPHLIQVHKNRFNANHTLDFYNTNWEKTNISQGNLKSNINYKKPYCYDELYELSLKLSKQFFHIRVDWYLVNNKIYFGELTLYDGGGFDKFDSYEDDLLLGSWLKLPIEK